MSTQRRQTTRIVECADFCQCLFCRRDGLVLGRFRRVSEYRGGVVVQIKLAICNTTSVSGARCISGTWNGRMAPSSDET